MTALLAALALTVAVPAPSGVRATTVAAAAKKKPTNSKDKKPAETTEGLDLTKPVAPEPTPNTIEAPPSDAAPPTVTETAPPPVSSTPGTWSIVTPRTAGNGGNLLEAGVGFPGVHATFLHGLSDTFDLGPRVDLNYGYAGLVTAPAFGFGIAGQLKIRFFSTDKLSIGASVRPGLTFYFQSGGRPVHPGLMLPITLNAGYAVLDKLNVGVFVESPIAGYVGLGTLVPILGGLGAEYFISSSLAVWLAAKAGPAFWTNGAALGFMLDATAGIGFHL
jgi:hypothetical protein